MRWCSGCVRLSQRLAGAAARQQVRPQDADLLPACGDDSLLPETGKISGEIDPVGRQDIRQLLLAQINDWARLCLLSFCQEIEEVAQLYEGTVVFLVRVS